MQNLAKYGSLTEGSLVSPGLRDIQDSRRKGDGSLLFPASFLLLLYPRQLEGRRMISAVVY